MNYIAMIILSLINNINDTFIICNTHFLDVISLIIYINTVLIKSDFFLEYIKI